VQLAPHMPLLRGFGAREEASAESLLEAIEGMRRRLRGRPLNADEAAAAVRLLQLLAGPEAAASNAADSAEGEKKEGPVRRREGPLLLFIHTPSSTQLFTRTLPAGPSASSSSALPALKRSAADLSLLSSARAQGRLPVLSSSGHLVDAPSAVCVQVRDAGARGNRKPLLY
jgi:hypothetical protein